MKKEKRPTRGYFPTTNGPTVRGVFVTRRSGSAFVIPDKGVEIDIAKDSTGGAWEGDLVDVALLPSRRGKRAEGRIRTVVKRASTEITVRVLRRTTPGERVLCAPADPRIRATLLVAWDALPKTPEPGELLRVTVGDPLPSAKDDPLWSGTALSSLGREDSISVQENLTRLNHNIPATFSERIEAEAAEAVARIQIQDMEGVEDIRALPLVTIDGADARDFDDAVYVEKRADGWRLVVAIADVSLYVRPGSELDKEAKDRGNSYYFPSSVTPMLPEALSNGACSLLPGEDKRVMVADMLLDANGSPREARLYAAVMRSHARLTYVDVQALLDGKDRAVWDAKAPDIAVMLEHAAALAEVLIRRRANAGSLDFDAPEAEFVIENGLLKDIRQRGRLFSHRLIEAFMVTANEAAAVWIAQKHAPGLYRVHPAPDIERLQNLVRALRAASLNLPLPQRDEAARDASWLPGLLEAASGTPQAFLVHRLALRSMMQARYDPELSPHFGLASACYCHFTSPIRRYADLVTHRALRHSLGLPTGGPIPAEQKLLATAEICNNRERVAQDAEREITRRLACLLLRSRVGETFAAVIGSVMQFGFFAELEGVFAEGMARVESLGNDYFDYDPDRQELRGQRTGLSYHLGQKLNVRLVDVNVGRLEITLVPADSPAAGERDSGRGRRQGNIGKRQGNTERHGRQKTSNGRRSANAQGERAPQTYRAEKTGSPDGGRPGDRTARRTQRNQGRTGR